jgi:hypothetical protein
MTKGRPSDRPASTSASGTPGGVGATQLANRVCSLTSRHLTIARGPHHASSLHAYVIGTYAAVVGFGGGNIDALAGNSEPIGTLARRFAPVLEPLLAFAVFHEHRRQPHGGRERQRPG